MLYVCMCLCVPAHVCSVGIRCRGWVYSSIARHLSYERGSYPDLCLHPLPLVLGLPMCEDAPSFLWVSCGSRSMSSCLHSKRLPPSHLPNPWKTVFRVTNNKNPICIKIEDKNRNMSTFQKKGIASSPCAPYFCSAPHNASFRWCRIHKLKTWWTARIRFSTLARLCPLASPHLHAAPSL